jgi:hypothetical protein
MVFEYPCDCCVADDLDYMGRDESHAPKYGFARQTTRCTTGLPS